MKCLLVILLVASTTGYAQTEFPQYANGLIYNETTMNRLGSIVDSLNVRFRSCDLAHPYYSFPQGNAAFVEVPNKAARKLIESGISFEAFAARYPASVKRKKVWVIKYTYTDYNKSNIIRYSALPESYSSEPQLHLKRKKSNDKISGWVLSESGDRAFYLDTLSQVALPFAYARLVQYVDCMIDTTASVFFPEAKVREYREVPYDKKTTEFIAWAERYPGEPKYPDYNELEKQNLDTDSAFSVAHHAHTVWDSLRLLQLDEKMQSSYYYKSLLADAVEETLASNTSDEKFEFYVMRYGNKADALKLMRSRKVRGYCSMDQRPRYHAMNICQMAAETAQWDIFLRSHLDIMNDRFERSSDGSYAWAARKTYLQELEELNIPAVDLLLGTSLRVSNVSDNHYWGSVGRVGRALTDARDKDAVEKQLLNMMNDPALDIYNRLLICFLFDHYVYNLEDPSRKANAEQQFIAAINAMPLQIQHALRKTK